MQVTKLVATTNTALEFAPVSDTLGVFRLTEETVDNSNKLTTKSIENFAQLADLENYFNAPRHFGETLVADSSQWVAASAAFRENLIRAGLDTEASEEDKESDIKPFTHLTTGKRTIEDILNFNWTSEFITNLSGEIIPYVITYDLTIPENLEVSDVKRVLREHPGVTLIDKVEAAPDEIHFDYRPSLEEMHSFKDYLEKEKLNEAWGSAALSLDVFGLNQLIVQEPDR